MEQGLNDWRDILVVGLYFAAVLVVVLWSSCRKGRETVKGYFLAGKNMHWIPIGFSLFASNIGSEHFVGLAGSGAKSGIAVVAFEWGAVLLLLLLGWLFLPVYLASGVYTMPEYLQKRFGGSRLRLYLSLISMLLYITTHISVDVYAGAMFIQQAMGWNTYVAISALLVITALYTIIGGLSAVIFADTLQTVVMLVGSIILAVLAYIKVGGFFVLREKYMYATPSTYDPASNSTCGLPREDAFHILRDPVNGDLPWPGVVIRSTLASLWYWCTSQVIVQRTLAAKNIAHARGATITAGYLKILPLFIIVFPGMISRVLYPDEVACMDKDVCKRVCDNEAGCSNIAYPKLILDLAPIGLRGMMMAVMVSALMSSLTSIFNSAATLFTIDIWSRFRKKASEKELLISGRLFVVALVGISIAWIPLIKSAQGAQLFIYIQTVNGNIAPPVCAIFILGVCWPRINEQGTFWGLLVGQVVGITRFVLDFVYTAPGCGQPDDRPAIVSSINFTYFSGVLLAVTAVVTILVSLCTEKPDPDKIRGLTIWSVHKLESSSDEWISMQKEEPNSTCQIAQHENDTGSKGDYSVKFRGAENSVNEDYDAMLHIYRTKMTISRKVAIFLNLNAILLLCVFLVLYIIFG